jgi:protein-disulfide isomerase
MTIRLSTFFAAPVAALGFLGLLAAPVTPVRAADFNPEQKAAIEQIVKDYIADHPEIIDEALTALDKRHTEQQAAAQKAAIADKASLIFDSSRQVVLGNPKGDVTVVEFFDYNCGYCKQALPDMINLIKEDKNLRFVLKEFPVLSVGSEEAARVAVIVNKMAPEKYADFHARLLGGRGQANKARALDVAAEIGLDRAKVEAEMTASPDVAATFKESRTIADSLGLNGTPSYIIGRTVIPGAIGIDKLKQQIADARTTCQATGTKPC